MPLEHAVRDLVEVAFNHAGLDWRKYVVQDPEFYRPAEVDHLIGDSSKARKVLGWRPAVSFEEGLAATIRWYQDHEDWWRPIKDATGIITWGDETEGTGG